MSYLSISANQYSSKNLTPGVPCALEMSSARVSRVACKRFHGFEASLKLLESNDERPFMSEAMSAVQDAGSSLNFMQRSVIDHPLLDGTTNGTWGIGPFLAYTSHLGACKRLVQAQKLGYKAGVRTAEEDMFKAKVTGGTGALYLGVRGLNLASYVKGIDTSSMAAPTLLGRATYALSHLGTALWGFVYALSLRKHINAGYDIIKFQQKMEKSLHFESDIDPTRAELERYVGFFKKWTLTQSAEEIAKKVRAKYSDEEFVQEALSTASELLNRAAKKSLKPQEARKVLREMIGRDLSEQEFTEALTMLGFELKVAKLKMKRALKLETLTNSACVKEMEKFAEELRNNKPLSIEEMQAFVEKTRPLVGMMEWALGKNFAMQSAYMFACLVGVAASITALAATGGMVGLVVGILFMLVSVSMTGLDAYSMYQAVQKGGQMGTFDETMYYISNAIYLLSMVAALVTIFVLSMGIGLAISALVIGSTGMSLNVYVRQKLMESEEKYAEEHPTLAHFYEKLKSERVTQEKLKLVFEKLTESDRDLLRDVQEDLTNARAEQLVSARLKEIAKEEREKRAILANLQRRITLILART